MSSRLLLKTPLCQINPFSCVWTFHSTNSFLVFLQCLPLTTKTEQDKLSTYVHNFMHFSVNYIMPMDNLLNFIFEYNYLLIIYTENDSENKWNICANNVKLIFVSLWKRQRKCPEGHIFMISQIRQVVKLKVSL